MHHCVVTDGVSEEGTAIGRVRLFPLYIFNRATCDRHFTRVRAMTIASRALRVKVIGQSQKSTVQL